MYRRAAAVPHKGGPREGRKRGAAGDPWKGEGGERQGEWRKDKVIGPIISLRMELENHLIINELLDLFSRL